MQIFPAERFSVASWRDETTTSSLLSVHLRLQCLGISLLRLGFFRLQQLLTL